MKKTLKIILIIIIFSFIFFLLGDDHFNFASRIDERINETVWEKMLKYIYFTFVTVSTIGYGDIAPKSVIARILVIILICLILHLIFN